MIDLSGHVPYSEGEGGTIYGTQRDFGGAARQIKIEHAVVSDYRFNLGDDDEEDGDDDLTLLGLGDAEENTAVGQGKMPNDGIYDGISTTPLPEDGIYDGISTTPFLSDDDASEVQGDGIYDGISTTPFPEDTDDSEVQGDSSMSTNPFMGELPSASEEQNNTGSDGKNDLSANKNGSGRPQADAAVADHSTRGAHKLDSSPDGSSPPGACEPVGADDADDAGDTDDIDGIDAYFILSSPEKDQLGGSFMNDSHTGTVPSTSSTTAVTETAAASITASVETIERDTADIIQMVDIIQDHPPAYGAESEVTALAPLPNTGTTRVDKLKTADAEEGRLSPFYGLGTPADGDSVDQPLSIFAEIGRAQAVATLLEEPAGVSIANDNAPPHPPHPFSFFYLAQKIVIWDVFCRLGCVLHPSQQHVSNPERRSLAPVSCMMRLQDMLNRTLRLGQ